MHKSPSQHPESITIQLLPENCPSPKRQEILPHKTTHSSSQFVILPIRRCLERKETRYCGTLLSFVELMPETVNTWLRTNGDINRLLGDIRGRRETINPLP